MSHRPTQLAPAPSAGCVDANARATAARAFFHEFWKTGDETLLKRAFAENFANGAARLCCAPAMNGLLPNRRLGAPEKETI